MSILALAFMCNMMSEVGIWSPSCGIQGLSDLLAEAILKRGGDIRRNAAVARIRVEKGRVTGVRTESGEVFNAPWVVSNVDYKRTFLELCDPEDILSPLLERVASTPYTSSEFCVYLGSIAGWTWNVDYGHSFENKLLIETPFRNLLMVGIYAATELFLGGVPTAPHTGDPAAQIILGETL